MSCQTSTKKHIKTNADFKRVTIVGKQFKAIFDAQHVQKLVIVAAADDFVAGALDQDSLSYKLVENFFLER